MKVVKVKALGNDGFSFLKVGYQEPAQFRTLFWRNNTTKTFWFPPTIIMTNDRNGNLCAFYQIKEEEIDLKKSLIHVYPLPLPHVGKYNVCMGNAKVGIKPNRSFWLSGFNEFYNGEKIHARWEKMSKAKKPNTSKIFNHLLEHSSRRWMNPYTFEITYDTRFETNKLLDLKKNT